MKLIAKKENTVIVEVTKQEFANLIGKHSNYEIDFKNLKEDINVDISSIYSQHYNLTSLLNTSNYALARTKLQSMLEILTPIDDLIEKLRESYEIK